LPQTHRGPACQSCDELFVRRPLGAAPRLGEDMIRARQAGRRRPRLEGAAHLLRDIADLQHDRSGAEHACTCPVRCVAVTCTRLGAWARTASRRGRRRGSGVAAACAAEPRGRAAAPRRGRGHRAGRARARPRRRGRPAAAPDCRSRRGPPRSGGPLPVVGDTTLGGDDGAIATDSTAGSGVGLTVGAGDVVALSARRQTTRDVGPGRCAGPARSRRSSGQRRRPVQSAERLPRTARV